MMDYELDEDDLIELSFNRRRESIEVTVREEEDDDDGTDYHRKCSVRSSITYPRLILRSAQFAVRLFPNSLHKYITQHERFTQPRKDSGDFPLGRIRRRPSLLAVLTLRDQVPLEHTLCHYTPVCKGQFGIMFRVYNSSREPILLRYRNNRTSEDKIVKTEVRLLKKLGKTPHFFPFVEHEVYETRNLTEYLTFLRYDGTCTLKEKVRSNPINEAEVWKILQGIAAAIKSLHRIGCYHMDLKLDSICITDEGEVKLADIGFAAVRNFTDGSRIPTDYTAPEAYSACIPSESNVPKRFPRNTCIWKHFNQKKCKYCKYAGKKMDYYGLGSIAYELFIGETSVQFFRRHYYDKGYSEKQVEQIEHEARLQGDILIPVNLDETKQHFLRQLLNPDPAKRNNHKMFNLDKYLQEKVTPFKRKKRPHLASA